MAKVKQCDFPFEFEYNGSFYIVDHDGEDAAYLHPDLTWHGMVVNDKDEFVGYYASKEDAEEVVESWRKEG